MKTKKKVFWNGIFVLSVFVLTIYGVFHGEDLEAMGEGCITIGTKGEGIDGIIRDGENGFLVERDDALAIAEIIETCVKDRGLCRRISEKACASAAGFSWEKNAGRNLEVIRGVKAMKI